jgi:glutathione S-transferase
MLKIFHSPRTRSFRVVWLAEEMGIPYEISGETVGAPSSELLAVNPSGKLPTICDGKIAMSESPAILHYLTQKYGPTLLARAPEDERYADYLQYLVFGEASMAAPLNPVLRTLISAPPEQRNNFTVEAAKNIFRMRLKDIEAQLAKGDYLAGDFSAADISVGWSLGLGAFLGLDIDYGPSVQDYFTRIRERPAFQVALQR